MTTFFQTLKTATLTAAIALGAWAQFSGPAEAMEIINCTADHLPVSVVHQSSGRNYGTASLAPHHRATWNTGRGRGFRVGINVIGPDKHYSNRDGGEKISIMLINGNTELVSGDRCGRQVQAPRPAPQPTYATRQDLDPGEVIGAVIVGAVLQELFKNR